MSVSIPEPDAPRMAYARCLEMVERWLTTCSATVCVTNVEAFDNFSDESLADMCTTKWGLDQPQGEENHLSWFEAREANRGMLIWAFHAFRVFATQEQPKS